MNNKSFADIILDMPLGTFFWLLFGALIGLWSAAMIILLIYLHFAYPR